MKEKITKKSTKVVAILVVICMLAMVVVPNLVRSNTELSVKVTDTGYKINGVDLPITNVTAVKNNPDATVNDYKNIYCVKGGAYCGYEIPYSDSKNDIYAIKESDDNQHKVAVKNSSALHWLLDNMYLVDEENAELKNVMKENLKNLMKQYNNSSNLKDKLNKSVANCNINTIDDAWINNCVEDIIKEKNSLFIIQQIVLWEHLWNYNELHNYDSIMQKDSNGKYPTIKGTKIPEKFVALYITLSELAKKAQEENYVSPNKNQNNNQIVLQEMETTSVKISEDRKTALVGPLKLKNNNVLAKKTFTATVNSENASKVETVNANEESIDVQGSQGEFYIKLSYDKGFEKGVDYSIDVNVSLRKVITHTSIIEPNVTKGIKQPLVTVKKEIQTTSQKVNVKQKEELKGLYIVVAEKVDADDVNKKIDGVSFKVKYGTGEEKTCGPTTNEGLAVIDRKSITEDTVGIQDTYTISEVAVDENKYIPLADEFTIYVNKTKSGDSYVLSKASFDKNADVKSKEVKLKDGSTVTVSIENTESKVKIIVPNRTVKPFDMALRKFISEVKRDGNSVNFGASREPVINEESSKEYTNTNTAGYYHTKTPVAVKTGDTVIYTIRVYNEGYREGYAKEITDYLPKGLEFVAPENSEINKANGWTKVENTNGIETVKTNKLSNDVIPSANGAEGFSAYAKSGSKDMPAFAKEIKLECKVVTEVEDNLLLVNVAEITDYGYNDNNGNYVKASKAEIDIDSETNNVFTKRNDVQNISSYYSKVVKTQNTSNHYKGLQDDDDFENVIVASTEKLFKFVLNKVDGEDKPLIGADFTVQKTVGNQTDTLLENEEVKGTYEVLENNVKYNTTYTYKVVEVESAPEYVNVMNGKYIIIKTYMNNDKNLVLGVYKNDKTMAVTVEDEYFAKYGYVIYSEDGKLVEEKNTDLYGKIIVKVNNDTEPKQVTVKIPNEKEKKYDFALRKYITNVDGKEVTSRIPVFKIDKDGNYVYNHDKTPVLVESENKVTYTFRVYNEGEASGYVKVIGDDIPEGLEFLPNDELNKEQRWNMYKELKDGMEVKPEEKVVEYDGKKHVLTNNSKEANIILTDKLSKEQEKEEGANLLEAFDKKAYDEGKITEPAHKEVKATFKVVAPNTTNGIIKNQAQIVDDSDKDGKDVTDKDSTPNKWISGEDDQDTEEIRLEYKKFDLALRKFITNVDGNEVKSRIPVFKIDKDGKYVYNHDKEPVTVGTENIVTYTLRVYNEGDKNGYAEEAKDDIPDGLEFLPENELNKKYRWIMFNKDGEETDNPKEAKYVTTDYLSKEQEKNPGENLLKAFDKKAYEAGKIKEPDYREVEIAFKVLIPDASNEIIVNHAEISNDADENGNDVTDEDSTPNVWKEGEDDQDIEKIKVQCFDLALRKFITNVNDSAIKTRIPVFKVDKNGKYVYNHDKEPVLVANTNIVTYTIRVYNEGDRNGYAQLVRDDIPEGLEFLPENKVNQQFRWTMLDKDKKETTEVADAKYIVTDYLSKEQEKKPGENLLKAFDKKAYEAGAIKEPDYRDVEVAFKVTVPDKSNEVIVNHAQIAEDADENGNPVTDIDSIPNVWNEGEDDQDIEKIKPQYFDLSLRKWVTTAIVIENGKETITKTGHKAEDNPEAVVKVDLKDSDIEKVKVKFEYKIRVKNEGQIPGYALEVRDDIPQGLEFVQADNKNWKVVDGKVVTDALKDTLLNPGETAEVTILLTWKNSKNNMGIKTNVAEISKDYNEYGAPDVDSTPNNNVPGEDDIDDAPVMITVKTGQGHVYVLLTISVLGIIAGGVAGIKKFVL